MTNLSPIRSEGARAYIHGCAEPFFVILAYGILIFLWKIFHGPSPNELLELLFIELRNNGFIVIAIAALIEAIVLLNFYLPGSVVIAATVLSLKDSESTLIIALLICWTMFVIGASINYLLGRIGFRPLINYLGEGRNLEMPESESRPNLFLAILLHGHPNFASISHVRWGYKKIPPLKLIPIVCVGYFFSVTFWSFLTIILADPFLRGAGNIWTVPSILFLWLMTAAICTYRKQCTMNRKKSPEPRY